MFYISRASLKAALGAAALSSFVAMSATPALSADIVIGIIGDQTGADDLDAAYQVLQQGVTALNGFGAKQDVVLHVGDIVESTQSEPEIETRFSQATALLDQLNAPWFAVAGDHDVNPPVYVQNSSDRSRETLFKQLYGAVNPKAAQTLYYSFDVNNYHFVALYSLEHLNTDPRWGNVFYSELTDEQFDWLAKDLDDNTPGKAGTIVFLHQPMWYIWTNWERVHALLKQHNVLAVIAGHYHYNQVQGTIDGIDYRIVGATGGATKSGNPNSGDLQHVTVLEITGTDLDYTMIPLAPYVQNTWTPRAPMDLVQALELNLGNIYSFPTNSPLFLDGGQLVTACESGTPAKLVVDGIGNAAAIPVNVTINVTLDAGMAVSGGTFGAGLCEAAIDSFNCQLKASAGVAMSNNSTVELSQYPPPPPLWTADIATSGGAPSIGAKATVQVIQSFQADNQTFLVQTEKATQVQACP